VSTAQEGLVLERRLTVSLSSRFPGVVLFSEIYQGEKAFSLTRDQRLTVYGWSV
jgi:hypothetical protein